MLDKDNYVMGIYWGGSVGADRMQDKHACVDALVKTFSVLSAVHDDFKEWYRTDRPKKGKPVTPIDCSKAGLDLFLDQSRAYDSLGNLMPNLGYLLHLKSELRFEKAHVLSIKCGMWDIPIPNSVVLNVKTQDPFQTEAFLVDLFVRLIAIWQPDWGVITRHSFMDKVETVWKSENENLGEINYNVLPLNLELHRFLEIEPFETGGYSFFKIKDIKERG